MIKKILAGATALILSCGIANAALVDSFDMPVDGTTASSIILTAGETYTIEVSGEFFIGGPGDGLADAEFFDFTNPIDTAGSLDFGVQIDGADTAWGAFDPTHVYTITFVGTGAAIDFSYFDTNYGDNQGSLHVNIFDSNPDAVPLPAAAWFMGAGVAAYGASRRKKAARS